MPAEKKAACCLIFLEGVNPVISCMDPLKANHEHTPASTPQVHPFALFANDAYLRSLGVCGVKEAEAENFFNFSETVTIILRRRPLLRLLIVRRSIPPNWHLPGNMPQWIKLRNSQGNQFNSNLRSSSFKIPEWCGFAVMYTKIWRSLHSFLPLEN